MSTSKKESQFTQGQTLILIALLLGAAMFVGWGSDRLKDNQALSEKAEPAYILKHECVIAVMAGRSPSQYRCDLPEKKYMNSGELHRAALAEAEKVGATPAN